MWQSIKFSNISISGDLNQLDVSESLLGKTRPSSCINFTHISGINRLTQNDAAVISECSKIHSVVRLIE